MITNERLSFSELSFADQVSVVMQLFDTPTVYFRLSHEYGELEYTLQVYTREKIFPATYSNRHQYLDLVANDLEKDPVFRDMSIEVWHVAQKLRRREATDIVMQYVEDSR